MDDQLLDQKLQEALALYDKGYTYPEIREHFKNELPEGTIAYIIRLTDEFAMEENRIKEDIKKSKFKMYLGYAAFALSLFMIYNFYKADALQGAIALLAYLPMAFAFYLIWKGYSEIGKLKKNSPEIDDSKFRMKRRRKAS